MAIKHFAKSAIQMPTPFTVSTSDPLDYRLVVENFSDLTNAGATFGYAGGEYVKVYEGMEVYVSNEKTSYKYVGPVVAGNGVSSGATAVAANWRKVSSSGVTVDVIEDLKTTSKNILSAVGITSGDTTITSKHTTDKYISGSPTVNSALTSINKALVDLSGYTSNIEQVVGVSTTDKAMTGLTGNCLSGLTTPTVKSALNQLDNVIVDNELVTQKAIFKLADASGFDTDPLAYSVSASDKIISSSTNVKEALHLLNNEFESRTSIKNVTRPLMVSNNTLSLVLDTTSHDTDTASTCYNILSSTTQGLCALADLHYDSTKNELTWINTRGSRKIQLTGFSGIKSARYDATTEDIVLIFNLQDGTTSETRFSVSGIITEYNFTKSNDPTTTKTNAQIKSNHNVNLYAERSISGSTDVYADIDVFDCGTY